MWTRVGWALFGLPSINQKGDKRLFLHHILFSKGLDFPYLISRHPNRVMAHTHDKKSPSTVATGTPKQEKKN